MPAGNYRHRVRIEEPTYTENDDGQREIGWPALTAKPYATLWASVKQVGSGQAFDERRQTAETVYEIRTRSSAKTRAITTAFRVVFDGRYLEIGAVEETEFRGREVVIKATEQTPAG